MEHKHLIKAIEQIFGPFAIEKDILIAAVERDLEDSNKIGKSDKVSAILPIFNNIFGKSSKVISKKVIGRYKEILKYYSVEDIRNAMNNAKNDDFHKDNSYKYCTLEYFSRIEQIDKWLNVTSLPKQSEVLVMPKFNIKE